ncbi:hypothetical protein SEA_HEXBUG_3 [Gordonia phage Hexbug]|nr:hypothetical protein SEA_ORLA_3 [Gordonia phage Orla]UVK62917.1 hypothetical protein SEA_HEXBUG_3 [Gordonia phage Hexbug]WNN96094.1 hypothetical protein SEA_NODIGI_3 [Gordonia phage Nodigi]
MGVSIKGGEVVRATSPRTGKPQGNPSVGTSKRPAENNNAGGKK